MKEAFINHHAPADWRYSHKGLHYIKVGAYGGDDDIQYVEDDGIFILEGGRKFKTLEEAYMEANRLWDKYEEQNNESI
jgi:hypothetical protein